MGPNSGGGRNFTKEKIIEVNFNNSNVMIYITYMQAFWYIVYFQLFRLWPLDNFFAYLTLIEISYLWRNVKTLNWYISACAEYDWQFSVIDFSL